MNEIRAAVKGYPGVSIIVEKIKTDPFRLSSKY